MRRLFLDTSAYSLFRQNSKTTCEAVAEADRVFLGPVVVGELLGGFDRGKYRVENRKELNEFLSHFAVSVLPMTVETAERYALIYNDLRDRGTPIPTNDLWIAASVMEHGLVLVTADRHFEKVHQIQTILDKGNSD